MDLLLVIMEFPQQFEDLAPVSIFTMAQKSDASENNYTRLQMVSRFLNNSKTRVTPEVKQRLQNESFFIAEGVEGAARKIFGGGGGPDMNITEP